MMRMTKPQDDSAKIDSPNDELIWERVWPRRQEFPEGFNPMLDGPDPEWEKAYRKSAVAFNALPESQRRANTCATPSSTTASPETSGTEASPISSDEK